MKTRGRFIKGQFSRNEVSQNEASLLPLQPPPTPGLRPIRFGPEICQDLEKGADREWIVTNGLGGYASSTVLGLNTRRTHGLLVAATRPPLGRKMLLSALEETLIVPGGRFELSTHRTAAVVHPEGYRHLVEFRLDPCPTFFFRIGQILLEKSVFMLPGENATVIGYTLHSAPGPVELAVRPLVNIRDLGELCREGGDLQPKIEQAPGVLSVRWREGLPVLMIHHSAELAETSPGWYNHVEYVRPGSMREKEDLWSFGILRYLLKPGESCALVASTGRRGTGDLVFHRRRLENTQAVLAQNLVTPGSGPLAVRLSWTAESFVARSSFQEGAQVLLLSGFPEGSPRGRDALVALPGAAILARRYDLARSVLSTLAGQIREGLVPARWSKDEASPEYDSADTSLWFFWAVWHYWRASRDLRFVAKQLLDPLQEILQGYLEGTRFGIGMDDDGLIRLTDEEAPLTWMNLPRPGKPVEVNALWYCALEIMAALADRLGLKQARHYARLARLVRQNFARTFVSPEGLLFDTVTDRGPDPCVRPNMLIALGLPFSPLKPSQGARILDAVERQLLTPVGVRSLSPADPRYRGRLEGPVLRPGEGWHQGAAWAWLMGPYVSAVCRVRGLTRAVQASLAKQLKPTLAQLEEGALGSVGEPFDGDAPHTPRGGVSGLMAVGELLRAIREARLGGL